MTYRSGRTIRRALAVMLGLGGLGVYATAQQPKPLVVQSTGTPGVYTVSGPTPGKLLPATVMPGVPVQPADAPVASEPTPTPVAAKPSVLPGVPVPPAPPVPRAATTVTRVGQPDPRPAPAVRPPLTTVVSRDAMPALPLSPAAPPPPSVVVGDAMPLAPLPPTAPQSVTSVGLLEPVAPLAPAAPIAPINPRTVATVNPPAPPIVVVPVAPEIRKPRVVVETTSSQVTSDLPGVPTPPVLLAPVLAPPPPAPVTPGNPRVVLPPTAVAQAVPLPSVIPTPAIVVPTVRTPAANQPTVEIPSVAATTNLSGECTERCSKCQRGKTHCHCVCAPATVPPPVGSAVRGAFATQRANAFEEYCVIYREDFDQDADTLNPTGERHISGIARRFAQTHAPVKIEPTGDAALDQKRTAAVISALTKAGVPVEAAASRVQGGTSRAEGMQATDIEPTYIRYGIGSSGIGGYGPMYSGYTTFGPFALYR